MAAGLDGDATLSRGHSHRAGAGVEAYVADPAAVPFRLGYRRWLDGLRGVAILLVLAFHVGLVRGGCFGVDIFFVLSGFLITTLLVEEWQQRGTISLTRFYARRGLRILPAFLTLLGVGFLYSQLFLPADERALYGREMLIAGCYVSNWPAIHQTNLPTLGHTWSLSVEEQFYLLWPLALVVLLRAKTRPRVLAGWLGAGVLLSAAARYASFDPDRIALPDYASYAFALYAALHLRADALLLGCLVGVIAGWRLLPHAPRSRYLSRAMALAATVVLAHMVQACTWSDPVCYRGLFTVVAAATAVIITQSLIAPWNWQLRLLEWAPLVAIGRISYGLYLYHIPILNWLRPTELGWGAPAAVASVVSLSFAAAVLSYYVVERPCLRWKHRFQPGFGTTSGSNEHAVARTVVSGDALPVAARA